MHTGKLFRFFYGSVLLVSIRFYNRCLAVSYNSLISDRVCCFKSVRSVGSTRVSIQPTIMKMHLTNMCQRSVKSNRINVQNDK